MIDFKGRVAIVTGAAGGIGLATAQHFVRDGAAVVLVDRDGERVTRAAQRPRGERVPIDADVPDRSQVEAMAEEAWARLGSVDVLVKNAGIAGGAVPRWELTNELARPAGARSERRRRLRARGNRLGPHANSRSLSSPRSRRRAK
ncbi:MAG: SDR family NAD(P)-dependent oxidoreductase [Candidatus Limnocylindria bacterium]